MQQLPDSSTRDACLLAYHSICDLPSYEKKGVVDTGSLLLPTEPLPTMSASSLFPFKGKGGTAMERRADKSAKKGDCYKAKESWMRKGEEDAKSVPAPTIPKQ
jgi:hypothetical protein